MTKPYSKQRWRFFDLGLFIHIAQRVAEDVGTVEYFSPWIGPFCTPHKAELGEGVPGVTRIDNFYNGLDDVDCFVFPDVGMGDVVDDLRRRGKRVFGCGYKAENIEFDRFELRKQLAGRGLPVAPYKKVVGITALREHLKANPKKWIKVDNKYRGILETTYIEEYETCKTTIAEWEYKLGAYAETCPFLVEDPSHPDDGVEMGDEQFFNGTSSLSIAQLGCEIKGIGYGGLFLPYEQLPGPIKHVSDMTWPIQKRGGLQGARSTEIRFGKKQTGGKLVGYYSDACQRFGCPPSGTMSRGYKNITEIMYKVAGGEDVTPAPVSSHCAEIIVWSSEADTKDIAVKIKDKDMNRILLRQYGKVNGQYYRTHHNDGSLVAECIGFGSSLEEAQQQARESVELVDFEGKTWEKDVFEQMDEKLDKARKFGLWPKEG